MYIQGYSYKGQNYKLLHTEILTNNLALSTWNADINIIYLHYRLI